MENESSPLKFLFDRDLSRIEKYFSVPELIRLQDVGMHCGLEYTSFPFYKDLKRYSRYRHSLGVAMICMNFSNDLKVAVSGLFHDISTPCFAHVIDFLNGDHAKQESTESDTRTVIASSPAICALLSEDGLSVDDVADYHLYPIADNDSPKLSADRLEYSLSNFINFGLMDAEHVMSIYEDISVGKNEFGEVELVFSSQEKALAFGRGCLKNGYIYMADEDRFSMEYLARKLSSAIKRGAITRSDLMTTESELVAKLLLDSIGKKDWESFRSLHAISISDEPAEGYWRIDGKKRYIDPFIKEKGRLSVISPEFREEVSKFLAVSFDHYLKAVE